jgi:pimeloyl-ACP methyl ester carboxylesterase
MMIANAMGSRHVRRGALVASLALSPGVAMGQHTNADPPVFTAGPCPAGAKLATGVDGNWLKCGTVTVSQSRDASSSRLKSVVLPVVIYERPTTRAREPVYFLAGGPGESAVEVATGIFLATPVGQLLALERPIIAFNQRGFGTVTSGTSPDLGVLSYQWRSSRNESIKTLSDSARKVSARLRARGIEPRNFTTLHAVDDIADVARALGHARIVLFATSYGTRLAMQFMRRHPTMVAASILDGVVPPQHTGQFNPDLLAERRRDVAARVIEDCLQAPACRTEYGDLREMAGSLNRAGAPPLNVVVTLPSDSGWVALSLNRRDVLSALGAYANFEQARAALPQLLEELSQGDTLRRPLAPQIVLQVVYESAVAKVAGPHYPVVYHIVLCGDEPAGVIQAGGRDVCDALGVPFGGPEAIAQVRVDVPTLMLSASYDAQTPPSLAEEASAALPRSVHVVFPGIGHLAYSRAMSASCVAVIVQSFLTDPATRPRDACSKSLTPAFLPRSTNASR